MQRGCLGTERLPQSREGSGSQGTASPHRSCWEQLGAAAEHQLICHHGNGQAGSAAVGAGAAGCDLFQFFFPPLISVKGISFEKAALIRNLLGQNEITPEFRAAKSSSLLGTQVAAYTISLSSHISFYLIYLAPYIPFSSPTLTIHALYPSSTYSSTHIQLYLPSHHYKYPIHPSPPIYLSSERPFLYLPSYIYTYISIHTPPCLSICHQQSAHLLSPSTPRSLSARILLCAGPSITATRSQGLGGFPASFTITYFAVDHWIRTLPSAGATSWQLQRGD